jgi:CheY-like chemotaxis protein/HPt (histidine-containing phosphotransfer) domain-containing protein
MVIRGLLVPYKLKVDTVSSGMDAIDAILKHDYDFVFMDHMMPGMDGVEATQKIRALALPKAAAIPIIALTANAVSGMREMCLESGFNDFISKPIEIDELDKMLHKWIPKEKQEAVEEEPEGQKEAGALAAIEGIDIEKGLERFDSDMEIYKEILRAFAKSLPRNIEELSQLCDSEDYPPLCKALHTLKGVSGNVDAVEIYDLCLKLEEAINTENFPSVKENFPTLLAKASALAESIEANLGLG